VSAVNDLTERTFRGEHPANGQEPPEWIEAQEREADEASVVQVLAERIPPHDPEAEAAILSVVMNDDNGFPQVGGTLRREHFFFEKNGLLYEACSELAPRGRPDPIRVADLLRKSGRLAQVGGIAGITEILNAAPAIANVARYAQIVISHWRARQAIFIGHRITAQGYAGIDHATLVASAVEDFGRLSSSDSRIELLNGVAIAAPLGEVDYLVREIALVAGGGAAHLVAGYGFSAKTIAVQSLALALATGLPVWGAYAVRPRMVIHVDFEQGDRLTRRRYQRLARAVGIDLSTLGDALAVAIMPSMTLRPGSADLWRELMAGRDLVVIDSLRAATAGDDENDSSIRAGLDMLGGLSEETGCRPLVVHHARKTGPDDAGGRYAIRGSSAIFDACDSAYLFSAEKGEPVKVEHVKARSHGEPVEDFALVVSDVEVDGEPLAGVRVQVHGAELVTKRREQRANASRVQQERRDVEAVSKALISHPGLGKAELAAAAHLPGSRLAAALVQLAGAVEVREEQHGRARTLRHYLRGTP
jgi:hypothetical protein